MLDHLGNRRTEFGICREAPPEQVTRIALDPGLESNVPHARIFLADERRSSREQNCEYDAERPDVGLTSTIAAPVDDFCLSAKK